MRDIALRSTSLLANAFRTQASRRVVLAKVCHDQLATPRSEGLRDRRREPLLVRAALWRSRAWLDQNVFRDAPPTLPRGPLWAPGVALVGVMLVGVQLLRLRSSAPLDSLWAEDGFVWLSGAIHHGFLDTLVTPYDGYLQTLSRLVAEPVSILPVRWFAPAMAISGTLIVAGCVAIVWRCSAAYIQTPWLRLALCALVVLTPAAEVEVFDNVTNSIWFIQFAAFWLLLWRPASFAAACGAAAILLLAALSTAGVILLFPVWLLRAMALRDRRDAVIVAAPAVGALAQVQPLLTQTHTFLNTPNWSFSLFPAYAQRVLGGGVLGNAVAGDAWRALGVPFEILLSAVLVVGVLLAVVGLSPRTKLLVALTATVSVALFVVSGYERGIASFLLWPRGQADAANPRYVICPSLLVLSAAFMALDDRLSLPRNRRWQLAAAGAVVALVALAFTSFSPADRAFRGTPTWSSSVALARTQCAQRHGSSVRLSVSPFGNLEIPCHRLT